MFYNNNSLIFKCSRDCKQNIDLKIALNSYERN